MAKQVLCRDWSIPTYAQPYIYINTPEDQQLPISSVTGEFQMKSIPDTVTVMWGRAPLVQLAWQADSLDWGGEVRVGGFVTSIHVRHMPQLEMDLAIMTVEAYPLKPSVTPYLSVDDRENVPYQPADFLDGVDDDQPEGVTTWLADVDSPLVGLMQDAMNQGHRLYALGQLASDEQGWHHVFAMPILLEAVTTFMR